MKKKKTPKPKSKRASFKMWVKKSLDKARSNIKAYKFTPGVPESHDQGIERTRKLEIAQAVFDAVREMHDSL